MSVLSFRSRIVFGLYVLCVFYAFTVDAQIFKNPYKTAPSRVGTNLRIRVPPINRQPIIPLASRTSNLVRGRPAFSSQTSLNSVRNVELQTLSRSSSSSAMIVNNLQRPLSVPSLTASSPAIMEGITHSGAAAALNTMGLRPIHQSNSGIRRLIPNFNNIKNIADYLKNGAIATAGTGGAIQIVEALKDDECCDGKIERTEDGIMSDNFKIGNKKTTKSPEFYNPLGVDK